MIEEICTKVGVNIQGQWTRERERNQLPDETVIIEVTDAAIDYQQSAPRVVFIPGNETFLGRDAANQDGASVTIDDVVTQKPRILYTRRVSIAAHIWGATRSLTENLLNCVVRAIYTLTFGSSGNNGGRWLKSSISKSGNVYVLDLFFLIPVPREPDPQRLLDEFPLTTEFVGA